MTWPAAGALALDLLGVGGGPVLAGPITFNTALPVAEDVYTVRLQAVHRERVSDGMIGREVDVDSAILSLGYGFTADWTGIAAVPWLDKTVTVDVPGFVSGQSSAEGIGDTTLLARYQAWTRNAPGSLLRVAPVFGVIVPTGATDREDIFGQTPPSLQPGKGVWGGVAGVVVTRQTLDWELDTALTVTTRANDADFAPGDEIELDASYQYRLPWPGRGAGTFSYAVLEAKGIHRDDDVVGGARVDNGGTEWRITPGLQYVARRWVVEAAVELPLADTLPDTALRDERIIHFGLRFNF